MKLLGMLLLGILGTGATVYAFLVPDAANFPNPLMARTFFWHFPCSICFTVMVVLAAYLSVKVVVTKSLEADSRAASANELGLIFASLTMATGILFSKMEWGALWSWDDRQYSFLMVILIYAAYFVLRASLADPLARAVNSSVYWCLATPAILFLTFVFPRLPQIVARSLHPSTTIQNRLLSGGYGTEILLTLALFLTITVVLYRQRVRAEILKLTAENL